MLTTGFSRIILLTTSSFKDNRAYDRNPWLEPLTLPAGAPWIFLIFFEKPKKSKKIKKLIFLIFLKRPKNEKNQKNEKNPGPWVSPRRGFLAEKNEKNKKNEKNPGSWVSPRGGFLAVGIPLPDPEWLQAGALAGALDPPCGGTLDFFDFFHFIDFFDFFDFFRKTKKMKKIKIFFDFFDFFFEKPKK